MEILTQWHYEVVKSHDLEYVEQHGFMREEIMIKHGNQLNSNYIGLILLTIGQKWDVIKKMW